MINRIERWIRHMINPYSTAFTRWWCHSGRYTRIARLITGSRPGRPGRPPRRAGRGAAGGAAVGSGRRVPESVMAARRAAIDALLAGHDDAGTAGS